MQPKNSKEGRTPLAARPQIELALPDAVDFGLGEGTFFLPSVPQIQLAKRLNTLRTGYVEKKGRSFNQVQHEEEEEEDEEMFAGLAIGGSKGAAGTKKGQAKLDFSKKASTAGSKAKAPAKKATTKGKGKAKQVVLDSEDEDDSPAGSSNTLRGDTMDLDDDDDGDDGFGGASKASSSSSRRKATPASTSTAKRPTRKTAPQTIMIDDSDSDSDSGLTFKVSCQPNPLYLSFPLSGDISEQLRLSFTPVMSPLLTTPRVDLTGIREEG